MKRALTIFAGIALFMAGLWGGSYFLSCIYANDWRVFPVCMTAVVFSIAGISVLCIGIVQ